jgi:thiol-disulfide isomerase/thioredoxin
MQKFVSFLVVLLVTAQVSLAQTAEVTTDASGNKVLKGFITKAQLVSDSSFAWFAKNIQGYTPYAQALEAFKANKDSIHILAFGGTWCDDTKYILPKFYALTEAAGFPQERITLLGVDHSKKTIQHLSETFNVDRVPTFIVLKGGKEIGRVVEWGKYGMFDKELGEIISGAAKK